MLRKSKSVTIVLALSVIVFCFGSVAAQRTSEKRELINEFRKLTGSAEISLSVNFNSVDIQDGFLEQVNGDKDLSKKQKRELRKYVTEARVRMDKRVKEYVEDETAMQKLSDETVFVLYERYFSEDELRDLIAFYKKPVGKKSLMFLKAESQKISDDFAEAFKTMLGDLVRKMIEEETALLEDRIAAAKGGKAVEG